MSKSICIQSLFIGVLFFLPTIAFGAVLESNEGTSADTENYGTGHSKGQSFVHTTDFDITSIEVWGGIGGGGGTEIELTIYEGEGIGGTELCQETNIDVSGWPSWTSADWQDITISCTGLLTDEVYTFNIVPLDGGSSDAIRWATSNATYVDGVEYYDGSARSSRDTMFRVNGTETGGGGGGGGASTTEATTTTLAINALNVTLLTFFGLFAFLIGVIIPLWIWKFFTR